MNNEGLNSTVCVLGAGPAGSTAAIRLAQLGHSVAILDKRKFPRPHIGESLPPSVLPLFDSLGIRDRIEREEFLRPSAAIVHWPPSHGYKEYGAVPGFQVDRPTFDQILLDAAKEAGASVLDGIRILGVECNRSGGWDVTLLQQDRRVVLQCSFVVDATGRRGLSGGRKRPYGAPTLALCGYWRGCEFSGAETRVDTGTEEWFWGAPLPSQVFNATVFVDPERLTQDTDVRRGIEILYRDLLRQSELLAPCLDGVTVSQVIAIDATCYVDDQPVAERLIKVGEASFSVDPLSSQGVQVAIGSGIHAASVVHTTVRRPSDCHVAEQFYRERQKEAVSFHESAAAHLYAQVATERPSRFWQMRSHKQQRLEREGGRASAALPGPTHRIKLAPEAQLLPVPSMEGDFIVMAAALVHPQLTRPVAFLENVAVGTLLDHLRTPHTVAETHRLWSRQAPWERIARIFEWLWSKRIVIEAG